MPADLPEEAVEDFYSAQMRCQAFSIRKKLREIEGEK
jgi:hypothetical protein